MYKRNGKPEERNKTEQNRKEKNGKRQISAHLKQKGIPGTKGHKKENEYYNWTGDFAG